MQDARRMARGQRFKTASAAVLNVTVLVTNEESYPMHTRTELAFIERALRNKWDIPPVEKEKAVALVSSVLSDPDSSDREMQAAGRCLQLMTAANMVAANASRIDADATVPG
jgi:hypothetical protein